MLANYVWNIIKKKLKENTIPFNDLATTHFAISNNVYHSTLAP
jgi:hypothetical protein